GLDTMPWLINRAISGHVSLVRIEEYLNGVQVQDIEHRVQQDKDGHNDIVQFPIGRLSLIAGPTGSGKSSLLSALIGDMTLLNGHIMLPTIRSPEQNTGLIGKLANDAFKISNIAYVAQEAWLRNATIRENILFGEPYNQKRYEATLHMCSLKPDLRILLAGDMTEIGERGVTLSGGQKQRVALARAIYSNRRILLIDDCLSAVDTHTAQHILAECFASDLSLMQGRTIVLVTHHISLCMPFAQHLVLLKNGKVFLQGTPQKIQRLNSFQTIAAELESLNKSNDTSKTEMEAEPKLTTFANDYKSEDIYNKEHLRKMIDQKGLDPNTDLLTLQGILVKEEEREEGYVKLKTWRLYMEESG
ncbi:hypothetical protein LPJ64_006293, partial [Coemansia asiatica]